MSLRASLRRVLEEYPTQRRRHDFAGNDLAHFIRSGLPDVVSKAAALDGRYRVAGSAGRGNWARCPWVTIWDEDASDSIRRECYVAYLFRRDGTGVYLSLSQGMSCLRTKPESDRIEAFRKRTRDYCRKLGGQANGLVSETVDLGGSLPSNVGVRHDASSICAKFFDTGSMPEDRDLQEDLRRFIRLYEQLLSADARSESP